MCKIKNEKVALFICMYTALNIKYGETKKTKFPIQFHTYILYQLIGLTGLKLVLKQPVKSLSYIAKRVYK